MHLPVNVLLYGEQGEGIDKGTLETRFTDTHLRRVGDPHVDS